MKKFLQFFFCCAALMLTVPLIPLLGKGEIPVFQAEHRTSQQPESAPASSQQEDPSSEPESSSPESTVSQPDTPAEQASLPDQVTVLHHKTGAVETMSMLDYVTGVVCAEIPASFEEEAIKAQAVVAHTYACYQIQQGETALPEGAQISTDPAHYQAFLSKEQFKERYKSQWKEYWNKIQSCVQAVFPQILTYEQQPIAAAFHAISSGNTEDAANVWGRSLPYLSPVSSEGDLLAPEYESQSSFSLEEAKKLIAQGLEGASFEGDPASWFSIQSHTASGYVDAMTVCGAETDGQRIRSLFSLRSADFSVEYRDGNFLFTTQGYGHGVGMSQYGADYCAKQGQTYDQILAHYYPGTVLEGG